MDTGIEIVLDLDVEQLSGQLRRGLSRIVRATALDVEAGAKVAIQTGTKSGRVYRRKKRVHRASAPGEAPATDEGHLVNSIQSRPTGELEAEVTVGAEQGAVLEYGGAHAAPRPFLQPAADAAEARMQRAAERLLEQL